MTAGLALKRISLALPFLAPLLSSTAMAADRLCNLSKTNHSCTIVIDRRKPIAPSTIQMYSREALTVVVKNPLAYERYFLDYSTGAASIAPDAASSIVQGLISPLGSISIGHLASALTEHLDTSAPKTVKPCASPYVTGPTKPAQNELYKAVGPVRDCLAEFLKDARDKYQQLERYVAPDSITPDSNDQADLDPVTREAIKTQIDNTLHKELPVSVTISRLVGDDLYTGKTKPPAPVKPVMPAGPTDAQSIAELTNLQKAADGVAADLASFSQRLDDLATFSNKSAACSSFTGSQEDKGACVALQSRSDDPTVYRNMVYRTVTYSLDSLNLVSNSQESAPDPGKKRALASVAIVFADTSHAQSSGFFSAYRWEASAGVLISTLSNRSYSVQPTYNTDLTVHDNTIHEDNARPTAVPFAAANYRLTDDLGWSRWKSNIYLTMAIGVNPNTKTADFALGPSIAWRAFMRSAFAHFGHEVKLTQGFTKNESLGATFSGSVPTDTKWTTAFAIAVSVRVPPLTGR